MAIAVLLQSDLSAELSSARFQGLLYIYVYIPRPRADSDVGMGISAKDRRSVMEARPGIGMARRIGVVGLLEAFWE